MTSLDEHERRQWAGRAEAYVGSFARLTADHLDADGLLALPTAALLGWGRVG